MGAIDHGTTEAGTVLLAPRERFAEEMKRTMQTEPQAIGINVYAGYESAPFENPDPIAEKLGIDVYREMYRRDDMVKSAACTIQLAALATGWRFQPAGKAKDQPGLEQEQRAADFQDHQLNSMPGSPIQLFRELLDPPFVGFMVAEKIWADQVDVDGDFAGLRRIARIKSLDPTYIKFDLDVHGDMKPEAGILQEVFGTTVPRETSGAQSRWIPFDLEDVVYWAFDPLNGNNPYGNSLLTPVYGHYMLKKGALMKWGKFMERFGIPVPVGRPPVGVDAKEREVYFGYLKNLGNVNAALFPSTWPLDLLQAGSADTVNFFSELFDRCNRAIARACLMPALVFENTATGAYALGAAHLDQFTWTLTLLRELVAYIYNQQVVIQSHKFNFPPQVGAPKLVFNPFTQEDMERVANVVVTMTEKGVPLKEDEVYERIGWKKPKQGDKVIGTGPTVGSPPEGEEAPLEQSGAPGPEEKGKRSAEKITTKGESPEKGKAKEKRAAMGDEPLLPAEQVADFDETNRTEETDTAEASVDLALVFESMAQAVRDDLGKAAG
jgi:hypothetical protein